MFMPHVGSYGHLRAHIQNGGHVHYLRDASSLHAYGSPIAIKKPQFPFFPAHRVKLSCRRDDFVIPTTGEFAHRVPIHVHLVGDKAVCLRHRVGDFHVTRVEEQRPPQGVGLNARLSYSRGMSNLSPFAV